MQLELGHAAGVASEYLCVTLVVPGLADDAGESLARAGPRPHDKLGALSLANGLVGEPVCAWKRPGDKRRPCSPLIQRQEAVGQRAQVDAGALAELHPAGVGVDAGGRWREEMAPVALVARRQHAAGRLVGAGGDHPQPGAAQLLAPVAQAAADLMRARLDPEDAFRAGAQRGELRPGDVIQLVQHMADDEHADGFVALEETPAGALHREWRKMFPPLVLGKVQGEGRVIVHQQPGEIGCAEELPDPPAGDAAAAAPVQQRRPSGRGPLAQLQFAEDGVPFPADALAKREIIALEVRDRVPVGTARPGGGKESFPEAIEHLPVE